MLEGTGSERFQTIQRMIPDIVFIQAEHCFIHMAVQVFGQYVAPSAADRFFRTAHTLSIEFV